MSNQAYNGIYGAHADAAAMAAHESSQAVMLDQMRDRLAALSDEARSIRSQVPHELGPDVERIQQQMQRLGDRLADLGRGMLVPYNAANPEHRATAARFKAIRYVTEDDVRVARVSPDEIIALGGHHGVQRAAAEGNPWDEASASALVRIYESGEAFAAGARREAPAAPRAQSVPPRPAAQQTIPARNPVGASTAPMGMTGDVAQPAAPRGCAIDSGLLDQRFAEIAARIEQSLAQIRPENALASLGRRFDDLEAQLNSMLGQVATRADIDELRAAESQIEEIASQLDQFRRQLARLDMIDAHLGTLTSQLSDERLTRLFNEGVAVSADVGRLDAIDAQLRMIAVQLSDERLCGLVSRSSAHEISYEELANAAAMRVAADLAESGMGKSRADEIGEMRGMIENLINERRNSDENNASMLDTVQQAIVRVLDRIDALEELAREQQQTWQQAQAPQYQQAQVPQYQHVPQYQKDTAPAVAAAEAFTPASTASLAEEPVAAPVPPTPPAPPALVQDPDDLIPATATVYAEMASADADQSDFLPMEDLVDANVRAYREDAEAEKAPRVPVYTTAGFDLDTAFSRSRDEEAEVFDEPQQPKRSMEVLRHDFIADAHRAKLKAAARPEIAPDSDMRAGTLLAGTRDEPAKPRPRRSIFSFRSQRVAMSLLVLLAAIPAAIFFMPRTTGHVDAHVAPALAPIAAPAHTAPAAQPSAGEAPAAAPMMAPDAGAPATTPAPRQTKQFVPPIEQGASEYEDVQVNGSPIDTASLPNGITMQTNGASAAEIAQMSEQARMAHLSGQLGLAAAHATPAALMEQHVLQRNGGAATAQIEDEAIEPAPGASKLPPATVGPFSMRLAAAQGDAAAQFEVASRLAEGKGTDQDLREAAQWYQRAAANGFALAQFRLATLYERGLGVKQDRQRAQVWYERAAAQGNVKAMHNLAVLAASRSPTGDYETAARWFQAASEHGLADSQFNLAVLYENGMGVPKDLQQAYKWLVLAAKSGDADAAGRRDEMKAKLDPGALAAADTEIAAWRAKPVQGAVNDARLASQAWKNANRRG